MESKPSSPKKLVPKEPSLNDKLTDKMADDRRYALYVQWAKDNGVIMDKVRRIELL